MDRLFPVVAPVLAADLATVEATGHRHAESVRADREARQDLVTVERRQFGDADLGWGTSAARVLHRLGEDEHPSRRVRVADGIAPCPLRVHVLVLGERPLARPHHPGEPSARGQHVSRVAGHEVRERNLCVDGLHHGRAPQVVVVGVARGEPKDLVHVERDAATGRVLVHDPADELALLVVGGPHARRADAVQRARQTEVARAALQVPRGSAGEVEADLRLAEQLATGLLGVGPLQQAHELFDGRQALERDGQFGTVERRLVLALFGVAIGHGPVERCDVVRDLAPGLVEPADLVRPEVCRCPLLRRVGQRGQRDGVLPRRTVHHGLVRPGRRFWTPEQAVEEGGHAAAPKDETRRRARDRA